MPEKLDLTPYPIDSIRLVLIVALAAFVVEFTVMSSLPLMLPQDTNPFLAAIVDAFLLTIFVSPVLWFAMVRPIQRLSRSRFIYLRRAMQVEEKEHLRIARDLHDGLGQIMTTLQLSLRALEEECQDPKIREGLQRARRIGNDVQSELRNFLEGLSPADLRQEGLEEGIQRMIENLRLSADVAIEYENYLTTEQRFPIDFEVAVFRIIQESLTNAIRHADAQKIRVKIGVSNNLLELLVTDNGKGFDVQAVGRADAFHGLIGIRERALSIGGKVEVHSSLNSGTQIVGRFPVPNALADEP